jgi:hypothetical protein
MYTIQDLKEGKCAVINDGTIGELTKVLKEAFPKDVEPIGNYQYYKSFHGYDWVGRDECEIPTQSVKDFLKEEFVLPEKYCVRNPNNYESRDLYDYVNSLEEKGVKGIYPYFAGTFFHFPSYNKNCITSTRIEHGYVEISFENFKKYVMKKIQSRFPFKLSLENAKRIYNIACSNWKVKLANIWAADLFLDSYVSISEEFYKEMRKACTKEQNELFDEIFGKDSQEIDFKDPSTINNLPLFGMDRRALIEVRKAGIFKNKGFHLDPSFNWELKVDELNKLCLIPTKK